MSNPYTLVFGQPPIEFVERSAQAERIVSEFCQDHPANYLNLITGVRGSGKTVFITQIAERMKQKDDWIIVNLNPQRDLLKSFAAKLDSDRKLNRLFREAEINLQAFGLGVEIKGAAPISDIEEALIRMLRSIKRSNKKVLITIDEVTNSKDMRVFASSYQIFLREKLPVFLLMTGLYKNIDSLRNADGMTFLERAPRTVLSPLDIDAIAAKYMETLGVDAATANRIAGATRGYAFAFQVIGYFLWENSSDMPRAMTLAREYLYEFAYYKIWTELSAKDKTVVQAIAKAPTGEVSEIRKKLDYSSNQFNPYRDRLLKAGIISCPTKGVAEIALPWFGDFALKNEADNNIERYRITV